MIPEHPIDDLPAYALGCLTPSEIQMVEQHLAVCADCRAEAASLRDTAAQIAMSTTYIEPPARVKHVLLSRVRAKSPSIQKKGLTAWLRSPGPGWAAAAFAMIIILLAGNLLLWNQVRELSRQNDAAKFQVVSLQGAGPAEDARGLMIVTADGRYGTLVVDGLPELAEEQQYQLWLIADGKRTSGGVFSVDYWGYGAMVIEAPLPLDSYAAFGVTIEPAGGSSGPTGDKVLGGSF